MYWTNYHSHCNYCDGTAMMEEYLQEAINQKLKVYGFSCHAPLTLPVKWCMKYENVYKYLEEAQYLKKKYKDLLQVYIGMEVDFIPYLSGPGNDFIKSLRLDYVIGSVHFVDQLPGGMYWEIDGPTKTFEDGLETLFKGNIKKAIKRYFELIRKMAEKQKPEIVGHLDKIKIHNQKKKFFEEDEKWYRNEVVKTLKSLAHSGLILEVNTRGVYKQKTETTYPSPWVLEQAREMKIPVTINSDAHVPEEVSKNFISTAQMLKKIGFQKVKVLLDGKWQARDFNEKGIDI